jgi:hypothetical protein
VETWRTGRALVSGGERSAKCRDALDTDESVARACATDEVSGPHPAPKVSGPSPCSQGERPKPLLPRYLVYRP